MGNQSVSFEGDGSLSPEDNLFGRVVLRNGLTTREEVEECVRRLLADRAEHGSGRSLSDVLVEAGYLEERAAEKIDRVISARVAKRRGAHAPPGDSAVIEAPKYRMSEEERENLRAQVEAQREHRMRRFVKLAIRSRLHQDVLLHVVARRLIPIDPRAVAASLRSSRKEVVRVLHDWKQRGIVKELGAHPFAFQPGEKDRKDIDTFCHLWRQGHWHARLLGMILEEEDR